MAKQKYDYLIVGSGLYGATFAHQMTQAGKTCLILEKREHVGGNIYTKCEHGINIHKYGAHIFHTNNEEVWKYIQQFAKFNRYTNSPLAKFDDKVYNLPFNMNTFNQLWGITTPAEAKAEIEKQRGLYKDIEPNNLEEQGLKLCGKDIYYKFIKGYTEKQWGCPATELPPFIINRIPFRFTYNNNYFNDLHQGIPIGGYTNIINKMLDGIDVKTNVDYLDNRDMWNSYAKKTLYTGCLDAFFDFSEGHLGYRSLRFENELLSNTEDYQGNAVVNYNNKEIPFTRIIEHKHFDFTNKPYTIITHEYPATFTYDNEPYYPINNQKNTKKYLLYLNKTKSLKNILFGGRLGNYTYADMDGTIASALKISKNEIKNSKIL